MFRREELPVQVLKNILKVFSFREEIGHDKPSREYFEYSFCIWKILPKDRAIIIGDSLSSDILGGINAGIRTVWFSPKPTQPKSLLTMKSHI